MENYNLNESFFRLFFIIMFFFQLHAPHRGSRRVLPHLITVADKLLEIFGHFSNQTAFENRITSSKSFTFSDFARFLNFSEFELAGYSGRLCSEPGVLGIFIIDEHRAVSISITRSLNRF